MTAERAFCAYEAVRHRLPPASPKRTQMKCAETLDDIADDYDAFLLDAFGVLNIGETAIPGVAERIASLRARGKQVLIVSNAAGHPHAVLDKKYHRLGYSFDTDDIVTSRATLMHEIDKKDDFFWGLMASQSAGLGELDRLNLIYLEDDPGPYSEVDGFLMIGSAAWTGQRQAHLELALQRKPRPVWVGNPDMVAPREYGFSIEPGYFAHQLADRTGITPTFFGKPFENIYSMAFHRLDPGITRDRIVMVGDSLHTDILGAQTAGIGSALISGYGFFAGSDVSDAIGRAGIYPDHIVTRP